MDRWAVLLPATIAAFACMTADPDHTRTTYTCTQRCPTGVYRGAPSGGGAGADGGTVADASALVTGTVGVFTDTLFLAVTPYVGTGTITFPDGVTLPVTDGAFQGRVAAAGDAWVLVTPGSTSLDLLPTFQLVDTTQPGVALVLGARNVFSEIFVGLLSPTSPDPARAQIVVQFVTSDGVPAAGVEITNPPSGSVVAYDTDGSYSDVLTSTGLRGMALIVNADALEVPGSDVPIAYRVAGQVHTALVRAARGAATFASVLVAP